MRRRLAATLVAMGLSVAHPAQAQLGTGRSGSSTMSYLDNSQYWSAVRSFGRCFSRGNRQTALELLGTEPGSREERAIFGRIFRATSQPCLGDIVRMSLLPAHLRGAVAEGIYLDNVALPPNLIQPALSPGAPIRTITDAARCYVSAHADDARSLVRDTSAGTREERDAITRIADDFFRCVPASARRYQFVTTDVRYRIVEAVLRTRWEPAARPAPGS